MNTLPREEQDLQEFLAGRDDLSKQLKSLPQPSPSPELDAAIFARISGELAKESQAVKQSTPALRHLIDFIQGHLRSFWYLPVGATALLLIGLNLRVPSVPSVQLENIEIAQIPVTTVAQTTAKVEPAFTQPEASVPTRPKTKISIARTPPNETAAPKQVLAQLDIVPAAVAPAEQQHVTVSGSRLRHSSAGNSSGLSVPEATSNPKALAEEKAIAVAELSSATSQKNEGLALQRTRAVEALKTASIIASKDTYLKKESDAPVALAKIAAAEAPKETKVALESTRLVADEKAMAAKPDARLLQMAAPPPPIASIAMPKAIAPEPTTQDWLTSPNLWLARIEALLDRGLKQNALKEWAQFQKDYPLHPVAKTLQEKIALAQDKKTP